MIARNVRSRHGEIDMVALDGDCLVFVEVKSARALGARAPVETTPLQTLRPRQRMRLRRLATAWLADPMTPRPRAADLRFDAIGVVLDETGRLLRLDHIEGAW